MHLHSGIDPHQARNLTIVATERQITEKWFRTDDFDYLPFLDDGWIQRVSLPSPVMEVVDAANGNVLAVLNLNGAFEILIELRKDYRTVRCWVSWLEKTGGGWRWREEELKGYGSRILVAVRNEEEEPGHRSLLGLPFWPIDKPLGVWTSYI